MIFSRKGFDSSYGGAVSPILPDGTMVTIPIPERGPDRAFLRRMDTDRPLPAYQIASFDPLNL